MTAFSYPTTVNAATITKYLYPDSISDLTFSKENPVLATIKKDRFFDTGIGLAYVIPMIYDEGAGDSHTIANAITYTAPANGGAYTVTHVKDYLVRELNDDVMAMLQGGGKSALLQLRQWHDLNFKAANRRLSKELFGVGSCQRGCIGSVSGGGTATVTITLATKADALLWNVGDTAQSIASAALFGSAATGYGTVTSVNESTGVVVFTGASSWNPSAGDYLFKYGDLAASFSARKGITGFRAWLAADDLTTYASVFGFDRSAAKSRTAGWYIDLSSLGTAKSCLMRFLQFLRARNCNPDVIVCHPNFQAQLEEELEGQVQYQRMPSQGYGGKEAFGFGIDVMYCNGVKVLADPCCVATEILGLTWATWSLRSVAGAVPRILDYTGVDFMQAATASTFQCRYGYLANLACSDPSANAVGTVPAFLDL